MNCKDIIKNYLEEKGFDGLHHTGLTCCCSFKDSEFMPCGDPHMRACEAGYIQPKKPDDGDFTISTTQYQPCPACKRPRPMQGSAFLTCPHCGDEIPF